MSDDVVRRDDALGSRVVAFLDQDRPRQVATAISAALAFYFVQQLLWPAPAGVLVQGVVIGGLTALISFGVALIYRANRIINFAQGELGAVPASLAVLLIVGPGLPYALALPVGVAGAVVLGAAVEFLLIRRFFKAPRLILTVVTIGVAQVLAFIGFVLPQAFDINTPPQSFPSPFDFTFNIGITVFTGNDVIAMLFVPIAIAALAGFFRYTRVGIAVRASAESADRASLLGIPVKRIETIVWVIAAVLSAVSVFLRAGIVGLPFGQLLAPSILVRALAAAVIGRMERLPTIFVAAVALGVIESAVIFHTGRGLLIDPILFVVIIGALIFQRRKQGVREEEGSSWQAARSVRPIPRELAAVPEVRWGVRGAIALALLVALGLPLVMGNADLSLAAVILMIATVAVSLVVLTGWAGQVSLGQVGLMGIGAAVAGWLTQTWEWELSLSIIAAGLVGAAAAMAIGLPALRIRGLLLSVTTLSFGLAASSYLLNRNYFDWLPVERFERPMLFNRVSLATEVRYYYLALAGLIVAILIVRGLQRSRVGRVLVAVRENEKAAQSYGVSAVKAKLTAFAVSGFIAAFAGGLFIHHEQVLGIQSYGVAASFDVFIIAVVGGLGSIPGAILGAVVIEGINYFRNSFPDAIANFLGFLVSGFGLIFVLLVLPGGLGQGLYGIRDRLLRLVADRRGILVPSLVADARRENASPETAAEVQDAILEAADLNAGPVIEPRAEIDLDEDDLAGTAAGPSPGRRRGSSRRRSGGAE